MNAAPCPFECAILSRACGCRYAVRDTEPLRQKIYCDADTGNQDCVTTLNHFRKSVNFSLGLANAPNALPRSKATLLQKGVLIGLQNALDKVVGESSREQCIRYYPSSLEKIWVDPGSAASGNNPLYRC